MNYVYKYLTYDFLPQMRTVFSGYREGLEGPLLHYTMKKYRSHRCVPTGLKTLLEADFREYTTKKSTKSNRR